MQADQERLARGAGEVVRAARVHSKYPVTTVRGVKC